MRVFSGSLQQFQHQLQAGTLFLTMQERFAQAIGRTPAPSVASSWRRSLPRPDYALRAAGVPESVHVTVEERIPYFGKRMDACLFGRTCDGMPCSVIVELKGWGEAEATEDGNVRTVLGGGMQVEPHAPARPFTLMAFSAAKRTGLNAELANVAPKRTRLLLSAKL